MEVSAVVSGREPGREPKRVLVGLVGRGIQLSRTPAMHEAEGRAQGLSYIYRLIDTDRMGDPAPALADILAFAGHLGFDGLNVTFPFKQEIIPLLDELAPEAAALGSVNTVVLRGGKSVGLNTDMFGFRESFRREMKGAERRNVLLLGAGGAGAAVAYALLEDGAGVLAIGDVDPVRAVELQARLERRFGSGRAIHAADLRAAAADADGIVNATPIGMAKLPGMPIEPALLRPECWVADIIYFPLETRLLVEARRRGCRTMNGEGMAVFQAARAFEFFTGLVPDVDRMRATFAAVGEPPASPAPNPAPDPTHDFNIATGRKK